MVHLSLCCFVFILLFTLLEARDSIFKHPPYQGNLEKENEITEAKGILHHQTIVTKRIKFNGIIHPEEEQGSNNKDGRKLKTKAAGNLKKKEVAKVMSKDDAIKDVKKKNKSSLSAPSPCNTALNKAKIDNNKKKKKEEEDRLDHVLLLCNNQTRIIPKKKPRLPVGFEALLSADYHFPNSHPPRHN